MRLLLLTGANEVESYKNMMRWIHLVAKRCPLLCESFPSGLQKELVKCCFQSLRQDELERFVNHLQAKMLLWGALCATNGKSGGSAMKPRGKGTLAFVAIQIGPFLD